MFARGSSLIIFPHHRQGCSKGSSCSFCHHLVTDEEAQLAAARPRKLRRKRIKANLKAQRKKTVVNHHERWIASGKQTKKLGIIDGFDIG